VSTFNPLLSRYEDFATSWGEDLFAYHRGVRNEVGGALQVFESAGATAVPTFGARSITSGGMLAGPDFERLAADFVGAIREAGPADAVYLSLHGSMAAENELDPEGYLIEQVRAIVGESIPIVVSLDLHGVVTGRMLQASDAVNAFHTYPHVDFYETGQRAARMLLRILTEKANPVTARVFIPALVRGDELITATGIYGEMIRDAQAVERSGLSAGILIGNPFTDVPELGTNVVVVLDGDVDRAEQEAVRIARRFWAVRHRMRAHLTDIPSAISKALAATGRVVLVDAADATSSGASGDSNAILKALLDAGCTRTALIPIVDPAAVELARQAGIGQEIETDIGGAIDPGRFQPVRIRAKVVDLSDGHLLSESHAEVWEAGNTAVLQAGPITLVVTSRAVSLYDRTLFLAHGLDAHRYDLNIVKSPHCQPRFFDDGAEHVINVDAPGSSSANLPTLGHHRCVRPMHPLDPVFSYEPKAQIYRRSR
jgi:microcystin degradation protein MlrC